MRYGQTIVNLNKFDRISHVILMYWIRYVCWDVQAGSNEVDGTLLYPYTVQGPGAFFAFLLHLRNTHSFQNHTTLLHTQPVSSVLPIFTIFCNNHDRFIQHYLKFRGLCLCLCFLGKNLSNDQYRIQGQFQMHFHSSLNNFKNIIKYEPS